VLPKVTYATAYSYETERIMTGRLIASVIAKTPLRDPRLIFNLDFHANPLRGAEPHLDCLCSDVRRNVDFNLTLTMFADLLYRKLAERFKGFVRAGPPRLFRKFIDSSGAIEITGKEVVVHLSKRVHNPLLKEAGLTAPTRPVPWLEGRQVRLCP